MEDDKGDALGGVKVLTAIKAKGGKHFAGAHARETDNQWLTINCISRRLGEWRTAGDRYGLPFAIWTLEN